MNPALQSVLGGARVLRAPRRCFSLALRLTLLLALVPQPARAGLNVVPEETNLTWRGPSYVPDELLVQFKDGVSTSDAMAAIRNRGAQGRVLTRDGLIQVKLPTGTRIEEVFDSWTALPEVEYVAPNAYGRGFFAPNDTVIAKFDLAWNLRNVGAYGAWDVVTGDPKIVLAIVDSGVAYEDHAIPSYEQPFLWPGSTMYRRSPELPGPFLPGYDFVHNDDHPNDDNGHGTFVATIAAGQANNVAGSAGIAFGVTILPVKVLDWETRGTMAGIVQGIRYAADQGADIMNLSLGFSERILLEFGETKATLREFFRPLKDAIQYAQRRGVIIVAAAGNFSDPELSLPAGYPGVISVGATGFNDRITWYSSWGPGLSFMAPGGDTTNVNHDIVQDYIAGMGIKPFRSEFSLCKPDSFNTFFFIGTSGAAPHVSGAVALLMSLGIKNQGEIEQFLRSTAIKPFGKPSGFDPMYGFGVIQIDKAVQLAASRGSASKLSVAERGTSARLTTENPSRGSATLALRISRAGPVRVQLFDIHGRLVRRLEDGHSPAGERVVRWDGKDDRGGAVGSGVYYFRIVTPDGVENRRVAVLR